MEAEQIYEINAERWAYGGEVIGRLPDGRAVFVPFGLPGERLKIELTEEKRGFARARLLEVLETSPMRITPRCKHYGLCGGCHFQHMDYPTQLAAKTAALRDTLERIGKFETNEIDVFLRDFVPAPTPWNYRNHIQLHLDEEGRVGYLASGSDQVVPIEECHLPEEAINQIWPQLNFEPIPTLERVSLRVGIDDEIMLVLETEDDEGLEFALDIPLAAVQIGPGSLHVLSDTAEMEMEVLGMRFQVSAGSFFQINTAMAAAMVEHLLEYLPLEEDSTVLELYCGVGLFSAFLAERAGWLIGVEENPLAVEDFAENLDAFDNVEIYEAPAEAVMSQLDVRPDVIVVDPPRTGLALPVLDAIVKMQPGTLAYVSCDPATFARDAKRMKESGFRLLHLTPFDLFPQTYHIETISLWAGRN